MLSTFLTIWLLHVAALITPGANVLLISQLAASGQARPAMQAALGVAAGAAVWSSAAVLGVHALFVAFPAVRLMLQLAGAMYLLYIASKLWRAQAGAAAAAVQPLPAWRAFRLGLLTNLSNPKSALFFGSVFSAALPPEPDAAMLAGAVALIVGNALAWHLGLAYVFSRRRVQAGYAAQRGVVGRLAGAALGALGLSLLVASLREVRR
jgi:threonine/homoserine/homoserine lactone efflux protein